MAYQTFSTVNTSQGLQVIFVYVNDVTGGLFTILMLFALFLITMLGSYFASERRTGSGNMAISFAVAGYFVAGASMLLALIPNVINIFTVIVTIAIAIIGTLWLIMSGTGD